MCQQQQVDSVVGGRAITAEEQIQRKLDNMKMSGMPERAIKTVEKMLRKRQKQETVHSENCPSDSDKVDKYSEDVLAVLTRYTRMVLDVSCGYTEAVQGSKTFA